MATVSILRAAVGRVKHGERHLSAEWSHDIDDVVITWYDTDDVTQAGEARRDGKTVLARLSLPVGADIVPSDRVEIDGVIYRIQGKILRKRNDLTGTEFRPRAHLIHNEG